MKLLRRNIIIIFALILLCFSMALCACGSDDKSDCYTVMLPNGEGYSVAQNSLKCVEKGGSVSFEIDISDGYEFIRVNYGSYSDGVLTIKNVNFSMTIDFVVRLNDDVAYVKNGSIKIEDQNGNAVRYGEVANFYIIPYENYVVERVLLNGAEFDFTREANGTAIFSAIYDEFISIRADCLGRECAVTTDMPSSSHEATEEHGGFIIISGTTDGIARYDNEIRIACVPIEGFRLVYMTVNNDRYYGVDDLTITVENDMSISALFIDDSYFTVVYDYNGGESLDKNSIEYSRFNENFYLKNGVDSWKKPGYVLTSWNTEPDGSGERHALGAMICMPKSDITLYAQYKPVTNVDLFEYADYIGHDGVEGYGISEYKGNDIAEVVLPLEYNGKKILSVGDRAFAKSSVSSVITNANIENIGIGAFSDMPNLTEILLFDSLRNLSVDAFLGSDGLRKVRINSATNRIYDKILETNIVDKQMLVKNSTGKKIVTLSGCSLAKGMHSELFFEDENLKDYDVIHMGVHARYGLSFLTSMVENYLNPGDIVVLSLENYQHMWLTDSGLELINSEAAYRLRHLEANYDIYEEFDLVEQKYNDILPALPIYFSQRANDLDNKVSYNPQPNRYDMNEHGDYTYFRPNAESAGRFSQSDSTLFLNMSFLDALERINEWALTQIDKGVRVCFIFPPILRYNHFDQPDQVKLHEDFLSALKDKAVFPVLGSVDDAAYPYYCFSDWYSHMSTEGTYIYTKRFIELLSAAVKSGVV